MRMRNKLIVGIIGGLMVLGLSLSAQQSEINVKVGGGYEVRGPEEIIRTGASEVRAWRVRHASGVCIAFFQSGLGFSTEALPNEACN
jgi:hypothetical protein